MHLLCSVTKPMSSFCLLHLFLSPCFLLSISFFICTHLLLSSFRISTNMCPTKISFNNWDQTNSWKTACFCPQLLFLPISLSPKLTLSFTPTILLSLSLSLPLHSVSQKTVLKSFLEAFKAWSENTWLLCCQPTLCQKDERLCMTTRGGRRGSSWGQS